jgi:uncharacterized surface protein with fasciclin (FAS1) repeats
MRTARGIRTIAFAAALAIGALFAGQPALASSSNIIDTLEERGRYTTLLSLLDLTGLTPALEGRDVRTLFAPTDEAFAKLPPETVDFLINNPDVLTEVLLYHVVDGNETAIRLVSRSITETLLEQPVLVAYENSFDNVVVNRSTVIAANIPASNGTIHGLDTVLLPPDPPITVESIIEVLQLDGRFGTLLTALEATGLTDALRGTPVRTLFAPTDAAFDKLPEGTLEFLLNNPDELADILLYHVVPDLRRLQSLLSEGRTETLQGSTVTTTFDNFERAAFINDARVINPNILAPNGEMPNGAIQTIDTVLTPPSR